MNQPNHHHEAISEQAVREQTTIRFLLNMPTEDPTYIDVVFTNREQAHLAIEQVLHAHGQMVALEHAEKPRVLLRSAQVIAAFPLNEGED